MQTEQRELEVALAREVDGGVSEGWDEVRFEATLMGNVTTCLTYVMRAAQEERLYPPDSVEGLLSDLKKAVARPGQGTWISLTLVLSPEGSLTLDYNYDQNTNFGLGATVHDYIYELELFPREEGSVPAWWTERIAKGDQWDDD